MTTTLCPNAFDYICKLVRDRSAIVLEANKTYLVESRLAPLLREHAMGSAADLVAALQRPGSQRLTQQVVEAMTTHETSFFRDLHPFDALRHQILPELIAKRNRERTLTIWSNACSSGQEVYTVAMILCEHFPELADWRVNLIASDLSTQVLERARAGVFNQTEVNRGLPLPLLLKYFSKQGLNWKISDDIRRLVDFRVVNLTEPFPSMPPADVVFLRNVLIYFAPDTKRDILRRVSRSMRPDGHLLLGGAETTMNLDVPFERVAVGKAVCYKPAAGKSCGV